MDQIIGPNVQVSSPSTVVSTHHHDVRVQAHHTDSSYRSQQAFFLHFHDHREPPNSCSSSTLLPSTPKDMSSSSRLGHNSSPLNRTRELRSSASFRPNTSKHVLNP